MAKRCGTVGLWSVGLALVWGGLLLSHACAQLEGAAAEVDGQAEPELTTEERRLRLEQAMSVFERHDYQEALDMFLAVYEHLPRPEVMFNIAVCYERLGRLRDAQEAYERAVDNGLEGDGLLRAQQAMTTIRPQLGRIQIAGPEGMRVRVSEQSCRLPCTLTVDPGVYIVSAPDQRLEAQRVIVEPGGEKEITLAPPVVASNRAPPPSAGGGGWTPGWLFFAGVAVLVVGSAGIVGFGIRTRDLEEQFVEEPTTDLADEGELSETLTNVAIGVAIAGGVLALCDLIFQTGVERSEPRVDVSLAPTGMSLRGTF
ncbi:MAG: tetratricopeptide repeat protein [Myxococcota bacterium]